MMIVIIIIITIITCSMPVGPRTWSKNGVHTSVSMADCGAW
jgi:hypothetical protein